MFTKRQLLRRRNKLRRERATRETEVKPRRRKYHSKRLSDERYYFVRK